MDYSPFMGAVPLRIAFRGCCAILFFLFSGFYQYGIIQSLPPPTLAQEGGEFILYYLISFIISVAASVVAYYICKWLDRDDPDGNQPKE